jgi:hypothetical protein
MKIGKALFDTVVYLSLILLGLCIMKGIFRVVQFMFFECRQCY